MQIKQYINSNITIHHQNFKGETATNSEPSEQNQTDIPQQAPLETSKAYATPQIMQGYKEIQTFDVPYIGKGKVYELANGHRIILVKKPGPTTINTTVGVGNFNEPSDKKQTSHLMEHLLAKACIDRKDSDINKFLSKTGATYNAGTSNSYTNYYIEAPIKNAEDMEGLINTQLKTLQNNFSEDDVEHEKSIITQELNSKNYATNDRRIMDRMTIQNLFNLNDNNDIVQPATNETIQNITKDDLTKYYNKFYQPKNMVTTIVGEIDDSTIKTAAKYFNQLNQNNAENIDYPKLPSDNLIQSPVRKDFKSIDKDTKENAKISLGFIGPNSDNATDRYKVSALTRIINNRLLKAKDNCEANEKPEFIMDSDVVSSENTPAVLSIDGVCNEHKVEYNLKTIYSILNDLQQHPVSKEELDKIKMEADEDKCFGKEDANFLADDFSLSLLHQDNLDENKYVQNIKQVTPDDIQQMASKYLDLNKISIIVAHPFKIDDTENANGYAFKGKINKNSNINFKGIDNTNNNSKDVHEYVLPNNLKVVLDTSPGISKTKISFNLHSKETLQNHPYARTGLIAAIWDKDKDKELTDKNISQSLEIDSQQISAEIYGNNTNSMEMLNHIKSSILSPDFNQKRFAQLKNNLINLQHSAEFDKSERNPYKRANDEMLNESPYHKRASLCDDLALDDVTNLYNQILNNGQGTVFITMPKEDFEKNKNEIFQNLTEFPPLQEYDYNTIFNKVEFHPLEKTKVFTQTDDKNQLEVTQSYKIIESGNIKDRAGLMILNDVLGGTDKSILFDKLRVQDKIAYSADSSYTNSPTTGKISKLELNTKVSASNDNLQSVMREFNNSIQELTSKPLSKEELDNAKTRIKSNIEFKTESSSGKNDSMVESYRSFYGMNYQEELNKAIDEMTPEYLQELAKYYFSQKPLFIVTGNKDVINSEKEYLSQLGEVVDCGSK